MHYYFLKNGQIKNPKHCEAEDLQSTGLVDGHRELFKNLRIMKPGDKKRDFKKWQRETANKAFRKQIEKDFPVYLLSTVSLVFLGFFKGETTVEAVWIWGGWVGKASEEGRMGG